MGTGTVPPDDALEGELASLRARAYGAGGDIARDPRALGRLAELEEWHAAWVNSAPEEAVPQDKPSTTTAQRPLKESPDSAPRPSSRMRALATSRAGFFVLGAAAAAAAALLLGAALLTWGAPHADATLRAIDAEPEPYVFPLVDRARELLIDKSTLQAHEPYRDVELWSAQSAVGNSLLALERSSDRLLAAGCVPPGADPMVEIYDVPIHSRDRWHIGLPTGTVARFTLNGDVVSVWLYLGAPPG